MIRPITTEELLQFIDGLGDIAWEGWLVGAVILAPIMTMLAIAYQYVAYRINRDKTKITFIPAQTDSNNYERMEEFFIFIDSLLRPKTLTAALLPARSFAIE